MCTKALVVKRPTPTTVLYTVSTRRVSNTLPSQIQRIVLGLLRIIIGLSTSLVLLAKIRLSSADHIKALLTFPDPRVFGHSPGLRAHILASTTPWTWVLPASALIMWLVFRRTYTEESLLVIRGLGVQTSTSSPTYLSTSSTRFIPTSMIQDIFIHEAFKGFEVKFYLPIVVDGEEQVVVVFPVWMSRTHGFLFFFLFWLLGWCANVVFL